LWVNCNAPMDTPQYNLLFLRYEGFTNGAQQPNPILGTAALGAYLTKLGFAPEYTAKWIEKLHEKNVVSISNVMMPERQLGAYDL
jgi:hypothetical protein